MLGKLSPSLTQGDSNKLVQAASNQHPNTLEFLLDAVRRQISGKDVTPTPISNRDSLYANLKVLTDSPTFVTLAGNVTLSLADSTLATKAKTDFAAFLSLNALSPVVISTSDAAAIASLKQANAILAQEWNADLALSQTQKDASQQNFTDSYLSDRAALITAIVARNTKDGDGLAYSSELPTDRAYDLRWTDSSGAVQILIAENTARQGGVLTRVPLQQISFGGDQANILVGSDINKLGDHLYGGAGDDNINGKAGADYLEGNSGDDKLDGGTGSDLLYGGTGTGTDTYTLRASDSGTDTIIDSDGLGSIKVIAADNSETTLGTGTINKLAGANNKWKSEDKRFTYTSSIASDGTQTLTLSCKDVTARLSSFSSGNLTITLSDAAAAEANPPANDKPWRIAA